MTTRLDQIRRAHASARPKPSNPSWCHTHSDLTYVLEQYDEQSRELAMVWSLLNSSMSWVRSDTLSPSAEAVREAFDKATSAMSEATP